MTSQISREEVEDELRKLIGPHKAHMIPRTMLAIDRYVQVRMRQAAVIVEEPVIPKVTLLPGQTDEDTDLRCCTQCEKVRILSQDFVKDARYPGGRRRICTFCRPRSTAGRTEKYMCKKCAIRKELVYFPLRKRRNPQLTVSCTACGGNLK
jgi:hypothetical protein